MTDRRRARVAQFAARVNRALGLLRRFPPAAVLRTLARRYCLSPRQARRYVEAAPAASRGITRAGDDGGVHREASGQPGAAAPGTGSDHRGESQFARDARARRLAASGAARPRRWRLGAWSTTTCLTAGAGSG